MVLDYLEDPDCLVPKRGSGVQNILFDDVGVITGSPSPAFHLFVGINEGIPKTD